MGFLAPALLALALAVAVPLLLHLLQRHQGPRVVFPALRYLRRAEKESARRIRLRQILLLLLRVAALILLALAAARPFIRGAGASHEPTAVVIILDNSLSSSTVMDDRRVLDLLKARAQETLLRAGPDDRFWLIRAGAPWEPALPGGADAIAARVRETEPTAAAGDLSAAAAHAATVLATGAEGRAREIQILTDAQRTAFTSAVAGLDGASVLIWHPPGEVPPNRGVSAVEIGGGLAPIAGSRTTVAVTLLGGTTDTVNVRMALDGRTVAAGSVPGGSSGILAMPARAAGIATGHVEIDADALHGDDRRYFAARVVPPPAVSATGANEFIDEGLEVLARAGRIRRSAQLPDVAILPVAAGLAALRPGAAAVIIPPAAPLELPALNRRLTAARIPWRYEARTGAGEARLGAPAGDLVLQPVERARVRQWYTLRPTDTAVTDSTLLRLSDGSPWAVRGEREAGGAYVLLASALDGESTTLPTGPAMLPLLDRLTGAWTSPVMSALAVAPGDEIALPAETDAIALPDGSLEAVGAGVYRAGAIAGVHHVIAGGDTVAAFAVNPVPAESELARLGEDELGRRFQDARVTVVDDAGDWPARVYRRRLGTEAWRPVALLALLVLLAESLVAASGRARRSAGTASAPVTGRMTSHAPGSD